MNPGSTDTLQVWLKGGEREFNLFQACSEWWCVHGNKPNVKTRLANCNLANCSQSTAGSMEPQSSNSWCAAAKGSTPIPSWGEGKALEVLLKHHPVSPTGTEAWELLLRKLRTPWWAKTSSSPCDCPVMGRACSLSSCWWSRTKPVTEEVPAGKESWAWNHNFPRWNIWMCPCLL